MTTSRVIQEEDIVKGTTRMQFRHLGSNISKNTSYFSMSQVVVIEQKSGERERVNIYDFLTTSGSSYRMDQKVFLIIDGEVSPLNIQTTEYDYVKSISENTDEVATSDSTSVTVVTGITENNNKVTRFHYTFSSEILKKIKPSKEVLFRYYSGPHMYTIKMRKSAHKKLIKMLGRVE
ncbi:MAG: hypothetical protein OEY34_07000 [Cyclobacteriaceae bacterium]|nr:hypothetical protein [Cyclobacteriaceae bacterium]